MPTFSNAHPVSFAQARKGGIYVFQGRNLPGRAYRASNNSWRTVGLAAPTVAPGITVSGTVLYYVARIDLTNSGSGYTLPPVVTLAMKSGSFTTAAAAVTRIREGSLSAIEMTGYGKGYTVPPEIKLEAPPGVVIQATSQSITLTSNQNNWAPTMADVLEVTSAAPYQITGLDALGGGSTVKIVNKGDFAITLVHESSASTAANRFTGSAGWMSAAGNYNAVLGSGWTAWLEYSGATSRWIIAKVEPFDGGGPVRAQAEAVARAHLRGKYQCYYRYVDDSVPAAEGGPVYSNLSPVREIDCGNGTSQITWTTTAGGGNAVELWRTTSNQATTLFRVAKIGGSGAFGSATDTLTDWELVDPDRTGYQAMPILLPNGELNANRFGVPPQNYSVAVMFQDRLWMAVDTAGGNANTLRFSETDEPESMPDVNELLLQSNLRATDYITALVPFAGALVVMQSRHCHRLTYVSQPLLESQIYLMAYRGCLNQRCWDIFDGRVYSMDDQGVFSIEPNGQVQNLTLGLWNLWKDRIDYSLAKWFTVRADKRNALLRVCVAFKGDGSQKFPTRMLVYSFDYQSWWEERYPDELACASELRLSDGQVALVYGTSTGALRTLGRGLSDLGKGRISSVTITNPGRGYRTPPAISAAGGHGAEFECGLNSDGAITGIIVKTPGTQYTSGNLTIAAPPAGGVQATATFTAGDGSTPVYWSFKSGCLEFKNDSQDRKAGEQQPRQCAVTYQPTSQACNLNLKAYYNNAAYPRSNVVRRDRGTGFVHSDEIPAAVLDMQATPLQEAEAHGVARALFAGRALDDMMGTDRHVSVALSGAQTSAGPVAIHSIDVYGVNAKESG